MKRFALVLLVACGGGDKPVERPVVPDVTGPPASPPPVAEFKPSAGPLRGR
jgi:hypothetical protein